MTQLAAIFPSRGSATMPSFPSPPPRRSRRSRARPPARPRRRRKLEVVHEALPLRVGQLRQVLLQGVDIGLRQLQRQQVGVGEIAVVVRLLLGAHGASHALHAVVEPRLLLDRPAVLDHVDLAACLRLDGLADEADRVDVLDLAAGAQLLARPAHRDVHVGAQVPLLHVAVAGAEIAQDGAHLGDEGLRLPGGAHVGPGHDLHQRHARAVEVDQGVLGMTGRGSTCRRPAPGAAARCRRARSRRRHPPPRSPPRRSDACIARSDSPAAGRGRSSSCGRTPRRG